MLIQCFARLVSNAGSGTTFFGIAIALLLCVPGCGGSDFPRTAPVSGTVTLKGKPIEGAEVYFVHEKLVAMATTDKDGHYELVQGAVPGENKVYFSKIEGGDLPGSQSI